MISPFDTLPRDCWVNINTAQLTENMRLLVRAATVPVLAVVKANGYGHGYEHAARAFLKGGASYLGVASLSEAIVMRQSGIDAPILIICAMLPHEMKLAAEAGFEFLVWRADHVEALRQFANTAQPARVHLKINTGMGRLGCWPREAAETAKALKAIPGVELVGLATHFASAYNPTIPDTDQQIERFDETIASLAATGIRPKIIHAANSSGALYYPKGRYDMVRFGISMYGVPGEMIKLPEGVKTAFTWHARITVTSVLPKGHGVSYAGEYVMPEEARVGVLPVGYADGFQRVPKNVNTVLVEGQERKTLGRICMDQTMIDLTGFGDITGAEVVLIGKQGNAEISVRDVAKRWGTNSYNVYCGVAARVPRRAV
ncbi:MAG: alanine racemase [Bdellovibrionales bacterium]